MSYGCLLKWFRVVFTRERLELISRCNSNVLRCVSACLFFVGSMSQTKLHSKLQGKFFSFSTKRAKKLMGQHGLVGHCQLHINVIVYNPEFYLNSCSPSSKMKFGYNKRSQMAFLIVHCVANMHILIKLKKNIDFHMRMSWIVRV